MAAGIHRGRRLAVASACGLVLTAALSGGAADAANLNAYVDAFNGSAVSQFSIGSGGLLAPLAPASIATATNPRPPIVSPDGLNVYVPLFADGGVAQFSVVAGGALQAKDPPVAATASGSTDAAVVSPDGLSLYAVDNAGADVSQFDIGANGVLSPKTPASVSTGAVSSNPQRIAVTPDGRNAYVANCNDGQIAQYDIGAGGKLTPKTPFTVAVGACPTGMGTTPDGHSFYVAVDTPPTVAQFDIAPGGGLVPKTPATVPVDTDATELLVSPDGGSVYVTHFKAGGPVSQFSVGAGGALTPKSPATVTTHDSPQQMGMTADGRSFYVASYSANLVDQFDVAANGTLSPKSTPTVATGASPEGVAVRPDQGPRAAFTVVKAKPGSASRFDASGSSDPGGAVARYDWTFGDGQSAANGGAAPTHVYAKAGTYTARLTVTDESGCSSSVVFTGVIAFCNGGPAAVATAVVGLERPVLSSVRVRPATFRAAARGASLARRRPPIGTRLTYRNSMTAITTIAVQRRAAGIRKGKRCIARPRHVTGQPKRCIRYVGKGSFKHADAAGKVSLKFTGRVRGKRLAPARYRLKLVSRSGVVASRPVYVPFRIVR